MSIPLRHPTTWHLWIARGCSALLEPKYNRRITWIYKTGYLYKGHSWGRLYWQTGTKGIYQGSSISSVHMRKIIHQVSNMEDGWESSETRKRRYLKSSVYLKLKWEMMRIWLRAVLIGKRGWIGRYLRGWINVPENFLAVNNEREGAIYIKSQVSN